MKPYFISAPEYRSTSSGVTVLYLLCDRLRKLGHDAFIVQKHHKVKDNLDIRFITEDEVLVFNKHIETIAIYPEIVTGNPLGCRTVARYVLYFPGVLAGEEIYDESELVFSYSNLLRSSIQNKIQGNLYLPVPDLNLFKDYGFNRRGSAYWTGKGEFDRSKIPEDCIEITRDFPVTQQELVMLFNFIETFYCFDFGTCLMYEAPLCGCPTVLLSEDYEKHIDTEIGFNGCTNSIEHIKEAKDTIFKVREIFLDIEKEFETQLQNFIKITQGGVL